MIITMLLNVVHTIPEEIILLVLGGGFKCGGIHIVRPN